MFPSTLSSQRPQSGLLTTRPLPQHFPILLFSTIVPVKSQLLRALETFLTSRIYWHKLIINSADVGAKEMHLFMDKQANCSLISLALWNIFPSDNNAIDEFTVRLKFYFLIKVVFFFLRCSKGHIPRSRSVNYRLGISGWPDRSLPSLREPLQYILNVSLTEKNTFLGSLWLTHLKWHQSPALKPTVIRSLLLFMLEICARVSKQCINFADWLHLDSVARGNRTIAFNLS